MFSLITNKLFIGAAIAVMLLSVLTWGLWQRSGRIAAEADLSTVTVAHQAAMATLDTLREDYQRQARALAWRQGERTKIEAERNAWEQRFKEALRDDQTVRAWADEPLPAGVRELLR